MFAFNGTDAPLLRPRRAVNPPRRAAGRGPALPGRGGVDGEVARRAIIIQAGGCRAGPAGGHSGFGRRLRKLSPASSMRYAL
jgi:hypothetical protein